MHLRIFVVDDDPDYAALMAYQLRRMGSPNVEHFTSGEDMLSHLGDQPDLIFLDVVMPGIGGLETLRRLKARRPEIPVVMVSAQSAIQVALEAVKLGAFDYVTKGLDDTVKIRATVTQITERVRLTREVAALKSQLPSPQGFHGILGESAAMLEVFRLIKKTLRGDLAVAILGESGTGKEHIAQAIHYNSTRRHGPFVIVNCAAIPRDLMESEFFGHEKGSFTGAHARRQGNFEQADGGTIFLDEVGELDLGLQAKLLRVLQNQSFQRVGGTDTIQVDTRVICATNKTLPAMIQEGSFREDLYYRLMQYPIQVPPLRGRSQDVLLLGEHFRQSFQRKHKLEPRSFSPAAKRFMLTYTWPGNVRELKNAVERALLLAETDHIEPSDLQLPAQHALHHTPTPNGASPGTSEMQPSADPRSTDTRSQDPFDTAFPDAGKPSSQDPVLHIHAQVDEDSILPLEEIKLLAVEHAHTLCGGNINQTALKLGVTRSTIYRLLRKREEA